MSKVSQMIGLAVVMTLGLVGQAHAAIDYSSLTSGLTSKFEDGVTLALPVVGAIIAAFLVLKAIRRVVKA